MINSTVVKVTDTCFVLTSAVWMSHVPVHVDEFNHNVPTNSRIFEQTIHNYIVNSIMVSKKSSFTYDHFVCRQNHTYMFIVDLCSLHAPCSGARG